MENDEENEKHLNELTEEEKIERDLKHLEETIKGINSMSTIDMYKWWFAKLADERDWKKKKEKKKSDSFIKRLMDKFKTAEDAVIEEESNDKPEK